MFDRPMSEQDKKWRAEDDARIIAEYLSIMKDKDRVKLASQVAKEKAVKLLEQANNMKKVARKGEKVK